MPKPTLALLLLIALVTPVRAEQAPDASALLQKVSDTYHALSSYQFEGVMRITVNSGAMSQNLEVPVVAVAERSGRLRLEIRHPQMGMSLVADGKQSVKYLAQLNQYTKQAFQAPNADSIGGMLPPPQGSPLTRYFDLLQGLKGAQITGAESIEIGGQPNDCWVVRCDVTPPQALAADSAARAVGTFWVDQARSLVLRDSTSIQMRNPANGEPMQMVQITDFSVGRVNEPLPDSVFAFVAPEGAKEVTTFGAQGAPQAESELVGKKAPPFTLTGVKGSSVSLSKYRGRVVVLDFWASWCGPCRVEMPRVQKIYQDLKGKGLVVFGINLLEDAATVKAYLAKNPSYTFPILLDKTGKVSGDYKADAIPTLVVIGKDGLIKSYFRGVREESVLREAIAKAGIK
jgi:peroxiredoxin/outer membrane lipoprotein-sorting protein